MLLTLLRLHLKVDKKNTLLQPPQLPMVLFSPMFQEQLLMEARLHTLKCQLQAPFQQLIPSQRLERITLIHMLRLQMEDLKLRLMKPQPKMELRQLKLLSQPQTVDTLPTLTEFNKKKLQVVELLPSLVKLIHQEKLFQSLNLHQLTHQDLHTLILPRPHQTVELQPSLKAQPPLQMVALLPMSVELMLMEDQPPTQFCQQLVHHMSHHPALTPPQEEEKLFTHTLHLPTDMILLHTLLNQQRMDIKHMLISTLQVALQFHTLRPVIKPHYLMEQSFKPLKKQHLQEVMKPLTIAFILIQMEKELLFKFLPLPMVVLTPFNMRPKLLQVVEVSHKLQRPQVTEEPCKQHYHHQAHSLPQLLPFPFLPQPLTLQME
jgi:hypothetical protein